VATDRPDLGELYHDTRERLIGLVESLDPATLTTSVPACPGWTITGVIYHLVAVAEDVLDGRLAGPPSEDETAAQLRRQEGTPMPQTLERWSSLATPFEDLIRAARVWPAVLDVVSHEQDIRGALGQPGGRDCAAIYHGAAALCRRVPDMPVGVRVVWSDGEGHMGPEDGTQLVIHSSRFETVRWRLGRRSRAQLAHLDWSADPAPVLDHLCVFGPAEIDIVE
jgi:uncharacterized protein (TIGR03083 family)